MEITGIRIRKGKKQWDVDTGKKEVLVEAENEAEALEKAKAGKIIKNRKKKKKKKK